MTDIPTQTPTDSAVEPAGVSEERLQFLAVMHFNVDYLPNADGFRDMQLALRELQRARQQLAEMRGRWIPFKPGDALPPRGAYLVCTKYNTGRPRDPIGRMETSRHTDDASAWNDYTVAYWSVPLPAPYDAALASPSQPSRGKCERCNGTRSVMDTAFVPDAKYIACPDCAQPEPSPALREAAHMADELKAIPEDAVRSGYDWLLIQRAIALLERAAQIGAEG